MPYIQLSKHPSNAGATAGCGAMAPKLSFGTTRGHTLAAELCMEWGTLNPDDRLIADLSHRKEDFQLEGHRRNGGTRQLSISKLKGHRDIAIVK